MGGASTYGEAWDFGEVARNQTGRKISQLDFTSANLIQDSVSRAHKDIGSLQAKSQTLHEFPQDGVQPEGQEWSQLNISGTGLGSFKRFRDALMGGSSFALHRYQGFVSGLHTSPNSFVQVRLQHSPDSRYRIN
ncbi:probable pullulanase 1, chloroplastic [Coccomyxa sp. Obi]|nr:probable pullulanase 1, chloroplastic [Coccomyxa sp. Obi]